MRLMLMEELYYWLTELQGLSSQQYALNKLMLDSNIDSTQHAYHFTQIIPTLQSVYRRRQYR